MIILDAPDLEEELLTITSFEKTMSRIEFLPFILLFLANIFKLASLPYSKETLFIGLLSYGFLVLFSAKAIFKTRDKQQSIIAYLIGISLFSFFVGLYLVTGLLYSGFIIETFGLLLMLISFIWTIVYYIKSDKNKQVECFTTDALIRISR